MTLQKALKLVGEENNKAKGNSYIKNPLVYALYQVWRKADQKGGEG